MSIPPSPPIAQKNRRLSKSSALHFVEVRRGRDWLLRSLHSLRLTPFPSARRRGPCKPCHSARSYFVALLFLHPSTQASLQMGVKTKKMSFDIFLLRCDLAEREGFEPPEPRSSTVFKTAAIDHSATSPRDKSTAKFRNHQINFEIFLLVFWRVAVKVLRMRWLYRVKFYGLK